MKFNMHDNNYEDIIKAQNGDKEIMASLVKNNMGLVYSITKRFQSRGYEMEDLNQLGTIGLIKAIKQFDTSYDVKLSTYSVPYILGEIKRYIRDDGKIKVSRSIKELAMKIKMIEKEYFDKKGKEITIEELAKILKVSKEEIAVAIDATSSSVVTSINEPIYNKNDEQICIEDMIQSNKNEETEITNKLSLQQLLQELNDRDKEIIILRYFKENTQTQIAKMLGVSQVQVSRIEKKILLDMRRKLQGSTEKITS